MVMAMCIDTNETLAVQSVSATGNKTFSLTPPAGTTGGTKYLRIRLAAGTGTPAFSGSSAAAGEVEDYAVTVAAPATVAIGDLVWNDADKDGVKDAAESGISGVTMELLSDVNADGVLLGTELNAVATTSTAADGTYAFSGTALVENTR